MFYKILWNAIKRTSKFLEDRYGRCFGGWTGRGQALTLLWWSEGDENIS